MFPVRCFTCNKVIGRYEEAYEARVPKVGCKQALNELNITRFCCRRMFLTHVKQIDRLLNFQQQNIEEHKKKDHVHIQN